MRNDGPLACYERKAPCHRPVGQGGGAEDKEVSGGVTGGSLERVFHAYGAPLENVAMFKYMGGGGGDDGRR